MLNLSPFQAIKEPTLMTDKELCDVAHAYAARAIGTYPTRQQTRL